MKYKVTWTVISRSVTKPGAAHSVTMEVQGLQESVTLAKDIFTRAAMKGDQLDLAVVTPTGGSFLNWHLDATPF